MKTSFEEEGTASEDLDLPLAGTVVLDLSQFLAGPSCAMRLADLGADVIKVERPDGGDLCRSLVLADQYVEGDSALFHTINRGKRSFAADLKDPASLQQVKALIARADVLIHNFRPGVMERIGLDVEQVARINPRLVYAVVSGYGDSGPWRDKPGQDLLVQSLSGLAWLSGDGGADGDGPPVPAGVSVVDVLTGAHLVQAIMAALLRRTRTGRGGKVEVSLLESALDLQFEPLTAFLNSDGAAPVRGAHNHANVHANPPYGIYRTADGFMAVAMTPLDKLAALIDCPALAQQAAAAERAGGLLRHRDALKDCLQQHLATRGTTHWLALLEPAGVWAAQVMAWPELVRHPGFTTLGMTQSIESASGAVMQTTRCPIRIDGQRIFNRRGAPALGADNQAVARQYDLPAKGQ
ncbi:CaiB/BaiF CoA-transferase family protein [Herbaspirillum sp. YR522]|uniref:CaiB/BaiF CoA transferase family protein n=1 Tax=Herbaspirillum sp. YR522 TaxID=1144342 RepID=UPI00026FCD9D|nr:CaiB/BaiF CoA-transferase family protein [Herbaspirillum sp. YR522]EJM99700.1 putative acyl-CoA transferase/carnitine dehydratase [Herbaspirillum sp. YR522]